MIFSVKGELGAGMSCSLTYHLMRQAMIDAELSKRNFLKEKWCFDNILTKKWERFRWNPEYGFWEKRNWC
jgi:hypothetical protein